MIASTAGLVSSTSASLSFEETDKITEQLAVPDSLSNDMRWRPRARNATL